MSKYLVYLCLCGFALRVLFMPMFFQFGTPGFALQASLAALCLLVAANFLLKGRGWPKAIIALSVAAMIDAFFFAVSKASIYGEYPYYPRYVVMSLPVLFGAWIAFKQR